MPLKKSTGNMYPWVTHTHTHLGGECPHECRYCYVDNPRFGRPERYRGQIRLIKKEFAVNYGEGKTIFMENCNDLFAESVPTWMIVSVIRHCREFKNNVYVFQTKNPARMEKLNALRIFDDLNVIFGTTIETNRVIPGMSTAPTPEQRYRAMLKLPGRKFVTVEPVMDFDVAVLAGWISEIRPEFLNLGADSKDHGLPEPTVDKIMQLVEALKSSGIELREKHNLQRLKQK